MSLFGGGLFLLIAIALCIHVVRTNQQIFWLFIILFVPGLGSLVYVLAVLVPELVGGTKAKRLGMAAREALDPGREYRQAKAAVEDAPTVHNQMRLAAAAAALGRHAEAETLYAEAAQGIHAEDPALLLGRANALLELSRYDEALAQLDKLSEEPGRTPSPAVSLACGRAYEGLGRTSEADEAYQWAAGRLPGLEGLARYAAFLARAGRRAEAAEALAEIDRRIARSNAQFRREARPWRDLAAQALG